MNLKGQNNVTVSVFIDEFGNILERNPKKPFGWGYFVCRTEDEVFLDKKLANCIPQKIHLKDCKSQNELYKTVKDVADFLNSCKVDCYGGSIIDLNSNIRSEVKDIMPDYNSNHKVKDQLEQFHMLLPSVEIYCALGLIYPKINMHLIYDVHGDKKHSIKQTKKLEDCDFQLIIDKCVLLGKRFGSHKEGNNIRFELAEKYNTRLIELPDVFAHITNRIYNNGDKLSESLYQLLEPHFNLFDKFEQSTYYKKLSKKKKGPLCFFKKGILVHPKTPLNKIIGHL